MRIGIDIGGSHLGVGLVDKQGNIIIKKEKDLPKEDTNLKNNIVDTISNYINEILNEQNSQISDIDYIGIAYPKSLRNGKFGIAVNLNIEGDAIKNEIQQRFNIPIYMKNDAKCAGIAEKRYGSLQNYSNAIFLSIGTGIGGTAFFNNELLSTPENDLFKIGHIIIEKDGIKCKCGRRGCFEQYASITALKREIINKYGLNNNLTGKQLHNFILNNKNDDEVKKIIDEYIENLMIGISNIINIFEPEAICIGRKFCIL